MEAKAKFSDRDWSFLVSLPHHVGLWIAHQDQGGGSRAYARETTALIQALKTSQNKYANIPFLAALLKDVSATNPAEEQWNNALQDCKAALHLMKPHCDGPTLNCFKLMLIDIAEAVVRAAPNGELAARNLYSGPRKGWYATIATPLRFGRGPNVTKLEKAAINQLIAALEATAIVQNWELEPFAPASHA